MNSEIPLHTDDILVVTSLPLINEPWLRRDVTEAELIDCVIAWRLLSS